MSDMWDAATREITAERREQAAAHAAVALSTFEPFLFEATSVEDFHTRVALQQESIAAALAGATEDVEARKAALTQMGTDFEAALAQRTAAATAEAQRGRKTASYFVQYSPETGAGVEEVGPFATADEAFVHADAIDGEVVEYDTDPGWPVPVERPRLARAEREINASRKTASGEVVQTDGNKRVIDMGGNPLSPRYKIEKNWGEGGQEDWQFESFSNDLPKTSVASRHASAEVPPGGRVLSCKVCHEPYRGDWTVVRCYCPLDLGGERGTVSPSWISSGEIGPDEVVRLTDSGLAYAIKTSVASRRTAASEIAAGDYIVAKGGLPDLRDGQSRKVMLTTNRPGKVTKIETFDEAFPKGGQRYDWIDAREKFEKFLGTWDDSSFDLDNHGDDVWVAHLDSGEIVPLDAARHYSDRFPTRSNGPQVPGQKAWNFASRQPRDLPAETKEALMRRRARRLAANPYSSGNPYQQQPQPAQQAAQPAAQPVAPQVTVNVEPPTNSDSGAETVDEEERQRRARDKINQTQMTQDLTAALVRRIRADNPQVTARTARELATATLARHPEMVRSAARARDTKESSPR